MKCQILFSAKKKENISVCCLLKILPRVLSVSQLFLYAPPTPNTHTHTHTHTIVAEYYGFMLDVRVSVPQSYIRFLFPDDNLSKHQWIFTKLGMCIDIVEIWFGIANG